MPIIYYDKDCQFELTEEEYKNALAAFDQKKSVYISRLGNTLSPFCKWSGNAPQDRNSGRLHDGTRVIKQFGQWKDADNPDVFLDPRHYPEILNDDVFTEKEYEAFKQKLIQ